LKQENDTMTTITEAFAAVAAIQQRLESENTTTRDDISRMVADIETARQEAGNALDVFREAINTTFHNLTADLMALRDGRAKAIAETIGETAEVVEFKQAAE
jgi:hypothetical protein